MDSNKLKAIIIVILALFAALYLGISAATAQFETIAWVAGGLTFFVCVFLGRKIWLLLPFMMALAIQFRLPGQPDTLLIAQILVIGFSTLLFLMRKLPYRFSITEMEFWMLLLTLFVFQVYVRNPVGLNIFGGGTVGGKSYVLYAIGLVTAFLLAGLSVTSRELKWVLPLSILGGLASMAVTAIGYFVPAIAFYTSGSFDRTDEANYEDMGQVVDTKAATRIGSLSILGNNLSLWISSYISPLKACFRPLWAILILVTVAASLLGGFRNGVAAVGMTFLVGIAYRSGITGLAISFFGGAAGLSLLAIVNLVTPLPPNVQRSLTFLPGTWEERYRADTKGSNEWRFEIWEEALLTDRWIKNKLLGDGLGFSAHELAAQMNYRKGSRAGISGFEAHRESVLANGDYHSGPVSAIRTIGYLGLIVMLLGKIRVAVHAHRQILRTRGTEWFPLALFIGIPLIWNPAFFVFVFGDFKGGAASLLLGAAMVRLLENNLPLPAYAVKNRTPYILPSPNSREGDQLPATGHRRN